MKNIFSLYLFFFSIVFYAQTDYSSSWEDFYSYNNVKDFIKVDNFIYALTDNAVFTYDTDTEEIDKISSVQGLSGETTSTIFFDPIFKRLIIGYENGLLEIVDEDGTITIASDIVNFNQSGEKSINHISKKDNKLYLSTSFAIVVYDVENLEFGDTYFIGPGSSALEINETVIFEDTIVAATEDGIFTANLNIPDLLLDFNNWDQRFSGTNFPRIVLFNSQFYTIENNELFRIEDAGLILVRGFPRRINNLSASATHLSLAINNIVFVLDSSLIEVVQFSTNTAFNFILNAAFFENNTVYLGSKEFGLLISDINQPNDYKEVHPEGPLSNDIFSITSGNNNLWVVYGGYDPTFTPIFRRQGFSQFNGENWINKRYDPNIPITDLNHITIDPSAENRVFISSFGTTGDFNSLSTGGIAVVENNEVTTFYNNTNSPLDDIDTRPEFVSIRISSTAFDSNGDLWVTNIGVLEEIKKLSSTGQWTSYNISDLEVSTAKGLSEMVIDRSGTKWIGTRRNGVYVFNENGNRRRALRISPNLGNLPNLNVRTIAIDASSRVWLGTGSGLVVYNNALGVFQDNTPNALPVVINADENGFGDRLLGDQRINSIVVDGADNKWFGSDGGGVIYTNPNGQNTIANFSKQNSPLPSNRIVKIAVDKNSGKVYFATDKGIVAYNSNVTPFGDVLGDVYAYPNPALKNHNTVTIDGRNGTGLPKGTNVKILDVSGQLVYETNVVEGQELQGGKVVWNKTNLAGNKVASGVYIVLLTNDDASENAVTKIAIVN